MSDYEAAVGRIAALHHRRPWKPMTDFMTFGQTVFPDQCDRAGRYSDHDFRPWTEKPQIDTKATVAALKEFIEPMSAPPEPKPLLPTDRDPAAVAAREAIPATKETTA